MFLAFDILYVCVGFWGNLVAGFRSFGLIWSHLTRVQRTVCVDLLVLPALVLHRISSSIFSLFFCLDTQRRGVEVNYLGHDSPDSSASRSLEQLAM